METMEIRKKRRICLVVAYDGTNYQGWQIQQNGNTIEAELNRALSALTKEPIEVSGASRTVPVCHARCNYAVFDTAVRMPGDKFSYALNQRLPEDIRVENPMRFHRTGIRVSAAVKKHMNTGFSMTNFRIRSADCIHILPIQSWI